MKFLRVNGYDETVMPEKIAIQVGTQEIKIETGKLADFTVLSNDIMKIPELKILETHTVMTVIGGEIVFELSRQRS